jgi:hypothetical protein
MLLEIRLYKTKAGCREQFIEFFERKALPTQEDFGIKILGQFRAVEDADTFVWLRAYEDAAERERLRTAFYDSKVWHETLEAEAFSLLEDYSNVILVEPTARSSIR